MEPHKEEIKVDGKNTTKNTAKIGGTLLAVIAIVGIFYWAITRNQIYTDKASIEAPQITIAAALGGTIQKMLVSEGQQVQANMAVAQVADQILKTKDAGIVVSTEDKLGKTLNPGETAVVMINPEQLRVVAHIDEDKGFSEIKVGQSVSFTVDAYGSKKYVGVVDEISQTSRQSGVVFNISDKREVKQFDVKIRFNTEQYSELKNGMSAKVTIFKN
jgi:multidrug resistance efflux pump